MNPSIYQLNISNGGVPKLPVQAAELTPNGLVGDRQRDTRHHGGLERAVCLFSLELIEQLQADGHPIEPGSTGENLTLRGIDWATLTPGTRLKLGAGVEIEVSSFTTPCNNLVPFFSDGDFNRLNVRVNPTNSRLYARVLKAGTIKTGDPVEVLPSAVSATEA